MKSEIIINDRKIGQDHPPYVIAEMSGNHNSCFDSALKLLAIAAKSGADAVKLQTYTPDTITLKSNLPDFQINEGLWQGKTLYDLYQWAHTPWEWHKPLFEEARKLDLTIFSSPFDKTAVDLLEDLDAPAYKIASFEAIDLPLIRYTAGTGKPMIISTGMANRLEIEEAVEAAYEGGCKQLAILHCVSGYPAPPEDYNLATIPDMINNFGLVTGLSDHTLNNTTAIASIALGASIIEKHFTLDRSAGGPDDAFSLEPPELEDLCQNSKVCWEALGAVNYDRKPSEKNNTIFRRSLYFVKDMQAGEIITEKSIRSVRPGYGIAPKHLDRVIGMAVNQNIKANTAVTEDIIINTDLV